MEKTPIKGHYIYNDFLTAVKKYKAAGMRLIYSPEGFSSEDSGFASSTGIGGAGITGVIESNKMIQLSFFFFNTANPMVGPPTC
jgi:hypothetical protein